VRKTNTVELKGFLPNAIESGLSAFDMKEGFANSPKAKRTKSGGWYLTIPFRIGTPNSSGQNFPAMPADVYQAIRAGRKADVSNLPSNVRGVVSDPARGKVWESYASKTSIFEGVTQTSNNPDTNRSTYGTFRRVSNKSDANSWIHTGIQARNLFDKAWEDTDIDKIINDGVDAFI